MPERRCPAFPWVRAAGRSQCGADERCGEGMVTGDLVGGRYRLGDRIGQGGTSVVYRGWDERLGRPVAVKALRAGLAADPSHQVRFRRAARSAATLNDPAIVAVYDSGETAAQSGPVPYTVMEYVDGETLRELLGRCLLYTSPSPRDGLLSRM